MIENNLSDVKTALEQAGPTLSDQIAAMGPTLSDIALASEAVAGMSDLFLTITQASRQLGLSAQRLRNLEEEGKLIPAFKTPHDHRRYSQDQINKFKRNQNNFEVLIEIEVSKLMSHLTKALSHFSETEKVCITIRKDEPNRQVHFTLDSEDGLSTFTKTLKMED